MININKKWLFTKKNNKRYKKQQFIKALKLSYINRKNNLKFKSFFIKVYNNIYLKSKLYNKIYYNINFNWLLKK